MTRERLSEEERRELQSLVNQNVPSVNMAPIYEYVEARVTAARLAEAAAENEACVEAVTKRLGDREPSVHYWAVQLYYATEAIRSRMTQPRDAALEKVRLTARLEEAQWWHAEISSRGLNHGMGWCCERLRQVAALSAPVAGAAQEASDAE